MKTLARAPINIVSGPNMLDTVYGPWSDNLSIAVAPNPTTSDPLGEPEISSAPQRLTVTNTDEGAVLAWTEPTDDGGDPVTGYNIWRRDSLGWG